MEIHYGTAPSPGRLVRPAPSPGAESGPSEEERAVAALHKLQARAGWLSALVYHHHSELSGLLEEAGVAHFRAVEDTSGSTAAFAFVLEGHAWVVFRGSNDVNDWARNVCYLPTWHFGFRRCFAEIAADLEGWTADAAARGYAFCVTGHSLGGALATLATSHLARNGRPIEMLCTFGAPRVFSPWQAEAFDKASANLPDRPGGTLEDVTCRFVDKFELVSHVPLWIAGFKHVGRQQESAALRTSAGPLSDAAEAYDEALKASPIMLHLLSLFLAAQGVYRALAAPKAHARELYARNIDPLGLYRIAHDGPETEQSKGRGRWTSWLVLVVMGGPRLLLAGALIVLLSWLVIRLFASAPLETLLLGLAFAAIAFVGRYLELRKQRRSALPPGRQDVFPPSH